MKPGRDTTADEVDRLGTLLEGKGHRRPVVAAVGGTWPQQYRATFAVGGVTRGISGTYADLAARIAALPQAGRG
jgi:hypothetical protein